MQISQIIKKGEKMGSGKILGIAASLRNARWGAGNRKLVDKLRAIESKEELVAYLSNESKMHIENYLEAGRRESKNFQEIYDNLMKNRGDAGLSNSEVMLAAALWAVHREGVNIDHVSLSEYFTASGQLRQPEVLRAKLLEADGLLVSGPVYFGDRGSLAESLIEFISNDPELKKSMNGRIYGGLSVGSKRNGGQETTLIYQMFDMVNLGLLAVGNDSDSTAQYGGTGQAGDVGTVHADSYGIETSMGTGRRMARVLKEFRTQSRLFDMPRTLFLILQDINNIGVREADRLATQFKGKMHTTVVNLTGQRINRCMACDICPSHIGPDEEYRCSVKGADSLPELHQKLLYHDLIVPVFVSMHKPASGSNYQSFVERTRYLRRSDYIWNDILVAPLVLEEPGGYRLMPLRMLTSFVRHQSVMAKPMIGYLQDGKVSNQEFIDKDLSLALGYSARLAAGRLFIGKDTAAKRRYNQIGYVISADKDVEDERMQRRHAAGLARQNRLLKEAKIRLNPMMMPEHAPYPTAKKAGEAEHVNPVITDETRHSGFSPDHKEQNTVN
jgi:multimeric flavodoxin WrbA